MPYGPTQAGSNLGREQDTARRLAVVVLALAAAACATGSPSEAPASSRAAAPAAAAPVAAAAPAGPAGLTAAQAIRFLDADRDGAVNRNEYLTFQAGRFPQMDANSSGGLSLSEFRDAQPGQEGKSNAPRTFGMFRRGGGDMDQTEWLSFHNFVFNNVIDRDRDGLMSEAEWTALMNR